MKKGLIIRIFLVLGIVLFLVIGVSYSLWNISVSQDKINTAMTSCFDITYSSESSAINLEKQYPISDEAGSKLTPYTFKITNNCDINAYYKINLETLNTSNIDTRFIKVSLNNTSPQVINKYNETEISLNNGKVANTLKTGYLPAGGFISFDLRVWLDYDTTISDIKNDGTDKWAGKVVVILSPVTEDEINKVCQEKGGDLVDGGECRKYYVKMNNFIKNPDFSNGANGWEQFKTKFISSNDNFISFNCPLNGICGFFQGPLVNSKKDNIYYISQNVKTASDNIKLYLGIEHIWQPKMNSSNGDNLWHTYSYKFIYDDKILELTKEYNCSFVIYRYYDKDDNEGMFMKNLNFVDLTLMFGEGNEPSKEWCDKYLDRYIEYNLEGTLVPIKEIGEPIKTSYYDVINLF